MNRDNDIDGILELTFSVDDEKFGERRTIDLKPGGRDIPVTNENKQEYVEYVFLHLFVSPHILIILQAGDGMEDREARRGAIQCLHVRVQRADSGRSGERVRRARAGTADRRYCGHRRGRLEEAHRLPGLPGAGRGDPELLEDCPLVGCRAEVSTASVHHGYLAYPGQRIQGSSRI